MSVYISGSLAFDRIMTFPGNFQDHILPDKTHMINISFMANHMEERRGGCAGNIAYAMTMFGEKPYILSSAGRDFDGYAAHLSRCGLPLDGIRRDDSMFTANCYVTTDKKNNQITGFYPGAMNTPCGYTFPNLDPANDIAIVSPGNIDDMRSFCRFYREKGVRYIYDPGQQIPVLSKSDLLEAVEGAFALITNDYELNMVCKTIEKTPEELAAALPWLITTLGEHGCRITGAVSETLPAVPCGPVLDPTGAGDAHRGGILTALSRGLDIPEAVRVGAVCASFAVECLGTQEYTYDRETFRKRYEGSFGPLPAAI